MGGAWLTLYRPRDGVVMKIESLMIGDELLDGRVVDTNSARFATAIGQAGKTSRSPYCH